MVTLIDPCNLCGSVRRKFLYRKEGFDLARCRSCQLVFVTNPPSASALAKYYTFASGYHANYADDASEAEERMRRAHQYCNYLEKHTHGGRLLDLGCSVGYFLSVARSYGWKGSGLELSEDTANLAREKYGLEVATGTIDDVGLDSHSIDLVTLWDVIEHVRDPRATLQAINRVLRPNGTVALLTPNIDGLFPRLSYVLAKRIDRWPHVEPPAHLFQFSKQTIQHMLGSTGFRVVDCRDGRQPLSYTFGTWAELRRSPRRAAYAGLFAPPAYVGPWCGAGDEVMVIAKKVRET